MSSPLRRIAKAFTVGVVGSIAVGLARAVRPQANPAPAGQATWEPLATQSTPPTRSGPVAFTSTPATSEPAASETSWVEPTDAGECPPSHPIKANAQSGIFHVPGGQSYARTKAERCYADPAAAEADGFRQAKR